MCSTPRALHPGRSRRLPSGYHSVFAGAGDLYRELEAKGLLRGIDAAEPSTAADEDVLLESESE